MSREQREYCDWCKQLIQIDNKKVVWHDGFAVDITYSRGGWGYARKHIDKTWVLCEVCYSKAESLTKQFVKQLELLQQK